MKLVAGLLGALVLPAKLRDRLAFRLDLPLGAWAATLSLLAALAGGIAWALGWLAWMEGATGTASQAALAGQDDATVGGLMFLGPLQALAYLFTPKGVGLGYVTLSGLVRGLVWGSTREAPGDPVVALCVAFARGIERLRDRRRAGALFGALPPDVVRPTGEGALEIVCAQVRRELAVGATVEVDGVFYRVVRVEASREGSRTAVVHALTELPPESVLRGLVRYR